MYKKALFLVAVVFCLAFSATAQKKKAYNPEHHNFHVHQHVWVQLRDGREVEAVIHGHISKKKYYVRQYHSKRQGKVHEKYIRAMSEEEIAALREKEKSKKK